MEGKRVTAPRTAIVFDLDGTLIDSAPDIRVIANTVLAEHGAAPISREEPRRFIGNGAAVFVERMSAARGIAPDPARLASMHARFEELYLNAADHSRLYPGVAETLAALRDRGFALGVCTNKPIAPTRFVLEHFGLADLFAAVLGGDSLPVRKPDPAPLHRTFDSLGGDGARIYVGDSEVDAETARRAGLPFLLFTEGYRKSPVEALPHHARFDSYTDLPALIDRLLAQAD